MIYSKTGGRDTGFMEVLIPVIMLLLITYSTVTILRNGLLSGSKTSALLMQVLNNVFPAAKATPDNSDEFTDYRIDLKGEALRMLGVDLDNPVSIVLKELPGTYVNSNAAGGDSEQKSEEKKQTFSILPFKLDDLQFIKQVVQTPPQTNQQPGNQSAAAVSAGGVDIFDASLKKPLDISKPEVLIYHTHTQESYNIGGSNTSQDQSKGVCAVGDVVTSELERYGISTIHDKTTHDNLYVKAYDRSAETLSRYMSKYGDFKLIIDLHRDSGVSKSALTINLNKENAAKIMFVMSTGNPHYSKNQAVVNKLEEISNKLFPSFCRDTYLYNNKYNNFNAEKSNNAVLIEVGAENNTLAEARTSGKYIARIIAEYINGKK